MKYRKDIYPWKKRIGKKNINLTETNQATYNLADDWGGNFYNYHKNIIKIFLKHVCFVAILDKDEEIIYDDESPNNHYKTENNNSSCKCEMWFMNLLK